MVFFYLWSEIITTSKRNPSHLKLWINFNFLYYHPLRMWFLGATRGTQGLTMMVTWSSGLSCNQNDTTPQNMPQTSTSLLYYVWNHLEYGCWEQPGVTKDPTPLHSTPLHPSTPLNTLCTPLHPSAPHSSAPLCTPPHLPTSPHTPLYPIVPLCTPPLYTPQHPAPPICTPLYPSTPYLSVPSASLHTPLHPSTPLHTLCT